MKTGNLILLKPQHQSKLSLGTRDFKNFSIGVTALSVLIHDSQEKPIWFMQVFSLAEIDVGETYLEETLPTIVLPVIKTTSLISCRVLKKERKNVK